MCAQQLTASSPSTGGATSAARSALALVSMTPAHCLRGAVQVVVAEVCAVSFDTGRYLNGCDICSPAVSVPFHALHFGGNTAPPSPLPPPPPPPPPLLALRRPGRFFQMSAPLSVFRRIPKLGKNKNTPPPYEFAKTLQNLPSVSFSICKTEVQHRIEII